MQIHCSHVSNLKEKTVTPLKSPECTQSFPSAPRLAKSLHLQTTPSLFLPPSQPGWVRLLKGRKSASPSPAPALLLPPKLPLGKLAPGLCQTQGCKVGAHEPDVAGGGLLEPLLVVVVLNGLDIFHSGDFT